MITLDEFSTRVAKLAKDLREGIKQALLDGVESKLDEDIMVAIVNRELARDDE